MGYFVTQWMVGVMGELGMWGFGILGVWGIFCIRQVSFSFIQNVCEFGCWRIGFRYMAGTRVMFVLGMLGVGIMDILGVRILAASDMGFMERVCNNSFHNMGSLPVRRLGLGMVGVGMGIVTVLDVLGVGVF